MKTYELKNDLDREVSIMEGILDRPVVIRISATDSDSSTAMALTKNETIRLAKALLEFTLAFESEN